MRRRSRVGGEPVKTRRRKAVTAKRRNAPKSARRRSSSAAGLEPKVARLTRELNEAFERQAATAEVLKVISRSTFDLQTVLNTVVETAARLCGADKAAIQMRDGQVFRIGANYGYPREALENALAHPLKADRSSMTGRVAMEGKAVHICDVLADPEYRATGYQQTIGFRTILGVPLLRQGTIIGVFALSRDEVNPFTEKQIELVTTFADQAVIAIENARLLYELRQRTDDLTEALEQQTATSEVLQVISSSPGDLQPVFASMLENAVRICDAKWGTIHRWEGDTVHLMATHNLPSAYAKARRRTPYYHPSANSLFGRIAASKSVVHIADAAADEAYRERDPQHMRAVELGGARTVLGVPMLKEDELIGALAVARQDVRPFTDKQIELVQNFAAQAVIAIENTRLLNELRESLQQQTATADVLKVISRSTFDLQTVLDTLVQSAARLCEADRSNIWRPSGEAYKIAAAFGLSADHEEVLKRRSVRPGQDSCVGRTLVEGKTVHILDAQADPEYKQHDVLSIGVTRSMLGVPLIREGIPIGVLVVTRSTVRPFTEKQIELLTTFADQAVIAIENVRLFKAEQQRTRELIDSLEQQTATSKVLDVISRSAFDLNAVFETVVESSARLCGADRAMIHRFDGEVLRIASAFNASEEERKWMERNPIRPGQHSGMARAALECRTIHNPDVQADPEHTLAAKYVDKAVRTILWVPILKGDDLLGVMTLYHMQVRPFTDKQIALVGTFADQAAIAIENVRLFEAEQQRTRELAESLEQQTATSDVLRVISSSPGDLQPVFEAMLENAVRICDAKFGGIYRIEGDTIRLVSTHSDVPAAYAGARRFAPFHPSTKHYFGRMMAARTVLHIADTAAEEGYLERRPEYVAAVELGGVRTFMAVPMIKENEPIGAFLLARQEVRPFTEKQIGLVTSFANQAIIAIENTRLLSELRQRTDELGRSVDELRALGEVSQAVNSTLDLENVLSTIVAKAVQLSGTEAGAIYVFDDMQGKFYLRATYGMDQELIDKLTRQHIGLDETNVAQALARHEPVQIADLNVAAPSAVNDIILRAGYRALLVAPLLRGEDIVGMLVVRRKTSGAFPQNTVDLIKTFAAQSALAIENARLFQNIEASLKDLRTAQDRLVQTEKLASLGQLTAGIAHEIKNPLNFVNNFSAVSVELIDELREALGGAHLDSKLRTEISEIADTLQGNLDKVVQHGKRADAIVKNMLLHSRQGSGEHRLVDINALVDESLNLAYHGARAEKQGFNITLQKSFDPAAGEVDLFPQEITRVLLNLISNGFYAATKRKAETNGGDYEPTLAAATKSLGDKVEIRIRDNGTGIPPEVKEKLFNPFFTTKPAGEGTGLGLSISHDIIVKQHSGSIEVDTRPGEFTEFRIVLPRTGASHMKSRERM